MGKISQIIRNYKREASGVRNSLFLFLLSWTAMILVMGWLDFLFIPLVLPDVAVTSYLILLGVYILQKEVGRWTGTRTKARPGEAVVFVWWTSLFFMVIISFITQLEVPESIKFVSYEILGALLVSEISKSLNSYKLKLQQIKNKTNQK